MSSAIDLFSALPPASAHSECICEALCHEYKCPAEHCGKRASRVDLVRNAALNALLKALRATRVVG